MDRTKTQTVCFQSESRQLTGRIVSPSHPRAGRRAVLFVHGQQSSQCGYEDRAKLASIDLDAVCLTFNLSGHGNDSISYSKYSVYDHLEDVITAFDYLIRQEDVDRARVGVCGASYGAYLAALLIASRAVKRLILRAPSLATDIGFPKEGGQPPQSTSRMDSTV
jgi:dipeptidyl aminopeptidase/acylaminoacyl peptidase